MAVMQMDSQLGQLCDEQRGPLISLIFAMAQGAKKQTFNTRRSIRVWLNVICKQGINYLYSLIIKLYFYTAVQS